MSQNVILTTQLLGRMINMNLGGMLNVCRNMSTDYTSEFGNKERQIGDNFDIPKPQRFQGGDGIAYEPEPLFDTKVNVKVDQFSKVHFECNDIEKTLSLSYIQKKYAKPIALALANKINSRAAKFIALNTFNSVGTPGTNPNALLTYLNAGDKLVRLGLPANEDLSIIINRSMGSTYIDANKTLYNAAGIISEQMEQGKPANKQLGYTWFSDETLYKRTTGAYGGTPLVDTAGQVADGGNNATMTLKTRGWTAAAAPRLKVGDRFTLDSVYSVHPQTRQSTGDLQQFVVLADFSSDGSGNGSVSIAPAITPSGQYQNVTVSPADGAALTLVGAASTNSTQGILMHENAYAFVSVPLDNPDAKLGVDAKNIRDEQTGMNVSVMRGYDISRRGNIFRADSLYGFAWLFREMACIIEAGA
jgi:hypothetical protein